MNYFFYNESVRIFTKVFLMNEDWKDFMINHNTLYFISTKRIDTMNYFFYNESVRIFTKYF